MNQQARALLVKAGKNRRLIKIESIIHFESRHHQTYLVTTSNDWLYESPLRDLEKILPVDQFIRIHRNCIVNLAHVFRLSGKQTLTVHLSNQQSFIVSRNRRRDFMQRFEAYQQKKCSLSQDFWSVWRRKQVETSAKLYDAKNINLDRILKEHTELSFDVREKLSVILDQPYTHWLGSWTDLNDVSLQQLIRDAKQKNQYLTLVAYRLFLRDETINQQLSFEQMEQHLLWVQTLARIIGSAPVILILEPNALAMAGRFFSQEKTTKILFLLKQSIEMLRQCPNLRLYLDGGHPYFLEDYQMAILLSRAGIDQAHGFSLNVSQYIENDLIIGYGETISRLIGDKPFIIDTGRNGAGTINPDRWCNPEGVGLGALPNLYVPHKLIDAFLWIKPPGESDGKSSPDLPPDGRFSEQLALSLVTNANFLVSAET